MHKNEWTFPGGAKARLVSQPSRHAGTGRSPDTFYRRSLAIASPRCAAKISRTAGFGRPGVVSVADRQGQPVITASQGDGGEGAGAQCPQGAVGIRLKRSFLLPVLLVLGQLSATALVWRHDQGWLAWGLLCLATVFCWRLLGQCLPGVAPARCPVQLLRLADGRCQLWYASGLSTPPSDWRIDWSSPLLVAIRVTVSPRPLKRVRVYLSRDMLSAAHWRQLQVWLLAHKDSA
jgi:hypothetical protein